MALSPLLFVRQHFPSYRLPDVAAEVWRRMDVAALDRGLVRGSEVAIGVGSRGIANLDKIVGALVGWWKARGMQPFIFPAMGSHGAATARGQAAVLAKFGVTAEAMGCAVRSSLAVDKLGSTPEGIPVVMDRLAHRSAGVMLCGRVKWHTDFAGGLESGLFKMMAIGLGKFAGAQVYHAHGFNLGLERVIVSVGRHILGAGKILGGMAILEDAHHDTARLEVLAVQEMEARERELLALVKTWMPTIPLPELDLVIVNQLGKPISGSGMDPKIINRNVSAEYNPWPGAPQIRRVYVRGLHPLSYGNAVGIGLADAVHSRLARLVKRGPTYLNALTSNNPAAARIPLNYSSDWKCLQALAATVGKLDSAQVTVGWIHNTQDLRRLAFTENLRGEIGQRSHLEITGGPQDWPFSRQGDLPDDLP
ncbi:MAG: hypothetical protein KJZ84_06205 [Bryobacteraceae bacterium]|nr:hypothetical protein [Bryobacteraceae bacterium]